MTRIDEITEWTVFLYGQIDEGHNVQVFTKCTNVKNVGSVLRFLDRNGNEHRTSVPWEIIREKNDGL